MEAQTKVPITDPSSSSGSNSTKPEIKIGPNKGVEKNKANVDKTDSSQDISLEDFGNFLMRKIGEKYRNGMEGLLEKFMTVFN